MLSNEDLNDIKSCVDSMNASWFNLKVALDSYLIAREDLYKNMPFKNGVL